MSEHLSPTSPELPYNLEVRWGESKVIIPNLSEIIEHSRTEPVTVLNETSVEGPIQSITVEASNVVRKDGKEATSWSSVIDFGKENVDDGEFLALKSGLWFKPGDVIQHGSEIIALQTDSNDVGKIESGWHTFLVEVKSTGQVHINNHLSMTTWRKEPGIKGKPYVESVVQQEAQPDTSASKTVLAEEFAKVLMLVTSYCNSVEPQTSLHDKMVGTHTALHLGYGLLHEIRRGLVKRSKLHPTDLGQTFEFKDSRLTSVEPIQRLWETATDVRLPGRKPTQREGLELYSQDNAQPNDADQSSTPEYHSSKYVATAIEQVTPKFSLDDIGGLQDAKQIIRDVALMFDHPEDLKEYDVEKPRGLLFHGPPGTGKTMLAHAVAKETNSALWIVDSASLYDMWQGLSGKNMNNVFDLIESHQGKLVVFLDEIDSIINTSQGNDATRSQVAGIFKQRLNTIFDKNPDVLIVGATNDLDRIGTDIRRSGRFDYEIFIDVPDAMQRREIISKIVSKYISGHETSRSLVDDNIDVPAIAEKTPDLSGADIKEIMARVARKKVVNKIRTGRVSPITQADIIKAVDDFNQSG